MDKQHTTKTSSREYIKKTNKKNLQVKENRSILRESKQLIEWGAQTNWKYKSVPE